MIQMQNYISDQFSIKQKSEEGVRWSRTNEMDRDKRGRGGACTRGNHVTEAGKAAKIISKQKTADVE